MNKHTATNPTTGRVYTRNSKTRTYSHVVVADFYYRDGSVITAALGGQYDTPQFGMWTSRLDLAEKTMRKLVADLHARRMDIVKFEVQILEAEVA